jgi:flagellar hook assembly protein FlgD
MAPQGDAIRLDNYVRCVRDADGTDVEDEETEDEGPAIGLSPTPNPFRDHTTLRLAMPAETGYVTCRLYDASGRLLDVLEPTGSEGGVTEFVWDGTSDDGAQVASGVFFARVVHYDGVLETRLVKLR